MPPCTRAISASIARAATDAGAAGLSRFQLQVMSPIAPMLAQTASDVAEALESLDGEVAFEWKMDGARIQVHKQGDDVRIFTRNLNEVTAAIPEIADLARAAARAKNSCSTAKRSPSPQPAGRMHSR